MPGTRTIDDGEMLRAAAQVLSARGLEGWLVGGSVRDRELGIAAPDLDLVVDGDPAAVAGDIARALHAPWFALSERHRAFRVVGRHGHVDVAAIRGGGILADLAERDFTVNAMALPVAGGSSLIDPFGGLADLQAQRLVAVSHRVFSDDPLRLMRAPRFSHVLGLVLEPDLVAAVRTQAPDLLRAAPERVAAEIVATLSAGRAGEALRLWDELALLPVIAPEVPDAGDLGRIAAMLDRLESLLADPLGWFADAGNPLGARLDLSVDGAVDRAVGLRMAGLVSGLTSGQARAIGRRLRLSAAMVSLLGAAAGSSRYGRSGEELPAVLSKRALQSRAAPKPAPAAVPRAGAGAPSPLGIGPGREAVLFLWDAAPWEPETILLATAWALEAAEGAAADAPSADGATADSRAAAAASASAPGLQRARALMALWAERAAMGTPPWPFDGVSLMRDLGLAPGPEVGKAVRAARLAWEAGEATTADEALAAAREAVCGGPKH